VSPIEKYWRLQLFGWATFHLYWIQVIEELSTDE
jgi:hypothetical protein